MIRNIHKTLEFLDKRDKEIVLKNMLVSESGERFELKDMLKDPTSDHIFVMWNSLSKDILEKLALEAYMRMKKIIEGVYLPDKVA